MGTQEISDLDGVLGVSRSTRHLRPAHYLFKIESFSLLSEFNIEKWESEDFYSSGYNWGLCLYPNGDKKRNGKGHISLYLAIRGTTILPHGWEVHVEFKLFVLNHIQNQYLTVQDVGSKMRCFRAMKTEWGFPQFLSLDSFKNAQNGYLLDDSCEFGAEVLVIEYRGIGECLSMVKEPHDNTFISKIGNYSGITNNGIAYKEFKVGEQKWKLCLSPRGLRNSNEENIPLYLFPADLSHGKRYVKYRLVVWDQVGHVHYGAEANCTFTSDGYWEFWDFDEWDDSKDPSVGDIVEDILVVGVKIMVMSVLKKFPQKLLSD